MLKSYEAIIVDGRGRYGSAVNQCILLLTPDFTTASVLAAEKLSRLQERLAREGHPKPDSIRISTIRESHSIACGENDPEADTEEWIEEAVAYYRASMREGEY